MKMLVFERPFQRDLVEPCKSTNNFSKGPKRLKAQKMATQQMLKICFITYCAISHSVLYHTKVCDIAQYALTNLEIWEILCNIAQYALPNLEIWEIL